MSKPRVLTTFEFYEDIASDAKGRDFLRALEADGRLTPELLSLSERFRHPFINADDFIAKWWAQSTVNHVDGAWDGESCWGPHWKRRSKLASRGYVNHSSMNKFGQRTPGTIWLEARWDKTFDFSWFFNRWVDFSRPSLAMLHLFDGLENDPGATGPEFDFHLGVLFDQRGREIVNIGWAMAYGEGYAHEVDVERVRAQGFPVDIRNGIVVVRVTEQLSDVIDDFPMFSRRRAELKALFRPELFWIKEEPTPVLNKKGTRAN